MFGFKSRKQREMDREMEIQRCLAMHRQHANRLRKHEKDYMEKAIRAKKSGDPANLKRLLGMVAQTIAQRRAIESQLLYFETILQVRDQARLFGDFAQGMKAMAKSVNDVFQETTSQEMFQDIEGILAQSTSMQSAMEMVLDRISSASDTMIQSAEDSGISLTEIEQMVEIQLESKEGSSASDEIAAGIAAIEQQLQRKQSSD